MLKALTALLAVICLVTMPDYIGNIEVPVISPAGVFPIVPDYPHGREHGPEIVVHTFGSANAKIEQRFLIGSPARRFTIQKAFLNEPDREALRAFWEELRQGPYQPFTYNAPTDDGASTEAFTVRFENAALSWEHISDSVSRLGLILIEVPEGDRNLVERDCQLRDG